MGITGFLALLLLLCGNLKPAKPIPVRPICDSRVMDKFIKEAKEAEIAMESCTNTCDLTEELSLPDPKVNVKEWMQMDRKAQAKEVWNGLAMFTRAMLQVRELVSDNALIYSVDKTYSNIRSVTRVLKSLNVQTPLYCTQPTGFKELTSHSVPEIQPSIFPTHFPERPVSDLCGRTCQFELSADAVDSKDSEEALPRLLKLFARQDQALCQRSMQTR